MSVERLLSQISELARFGSVGLVATGTHSAIYLVALAALTPQVANIAGYLCAVLVSYLGHKRITFRQNISNSGRWFHRTVKFAAVSLLGLIINAGFVELSVNILKMSPRIAVIFIGCVTPVLTYILLKLWVFGRS